MRLEDKPGIDPIDQLIREDRLAHPAPGLGEAALARIMAEVPRAARTASRPGLLARARAQFAEWLRPPAWQAFAAAAIAGVLAGAVMPALTPAETEPASAADEFLAYTGTGSTFAYLLEEDV